MSRIRIVGGTITKTTGGAHNMYSEENIVFNSGKTITEVGEENGITFGEPKDAPKITETKDFDITFELDKNEKSVVPFGILDFNNNSENPFFSFKYKLSKSKIDSLSFQILDESDTVIYQMTSLKAVIVEASKKPEILFEAKKPTEGPLISKTWDFQKIYNKYAILEPDDYTSEGEYFIHWDGFDDNEIYDSTRFNDKKLKAKIIATKGNKQKSLTVGFSTKYSKVDWTDVKIDKKAKRIDVTLRVNLKDGGEEGLSCWPNTRNFNPPYTKSEICDWDKIPQSEIDPANPIIKNRTRSFSDLEKLAIEGLNYHWSRNKNNSQGKNVKINDDFFEVYTNAVNTSVKAMDDINLIYNTNKEWLRSMNPGSVSNIQSFFGQVMPERVVYNVGYMKGEKRWYWMGDFGTIDKDFSYTSAHEIGHEILKLYAVNNDFYSYKHKGSSSLSDTLPVSEGGVDYPSIGEIDLMKYFNNEPRWKDFSRVVVAEFDLLGLLWLSKIKIN